MRDTEIVLEIHTYASPDMANPLSVRDDYMGTKQEVYRYGVDGKKTHINAKLKQD
jgi:hypothetical protein